MGSGSLGQVDPNDQLKQYLMQSVAPKVDLMQRMLSGGLQQAGQTIGGDLQQVAGVMNDPRNSWIGMNPLGRAVAGGAAAGAGLLGQIAYHGSPHMFEKFAIGKAGAEGAGGASFGLGINLSKDINHAKAYAGQGGHIYEVDLPDDAVKNFIKWEQPIPPELAKEIPPVDFKQPIPFGKGATIRNFNGQWQLHTSSGTAFPLREQEVMRMFGDTNTGEQAYRKLVASLGGDERAASDWLNQRGIKGIQNNTERGAENYVVFDDQLPVIKSRK